MIYILEGPDGSGKSSLAKRLAEQGGFKIVHRTRPKSNAEKLEMFNSYVEIAKSGEDIILDRAWYSEIVYGEIMRDDSSISEKQMWELEMLVIKNGGGMIIYCTEDPDVLWERCTRRGEDYITDYETLRSISFAYDALFYGVHHFLPVVVYKII